MLLRLDWTLRPLEQAVKVERSDGFRCCASLLQEPPEWTRIVAQPVDAGETMLISAAPGSGSWAWSWCIRLFLRVLRVGVFCCHVENHGLR